MPTIKTYDSAPNSYSWTGTNFQNQIASLIDVNESIVVKEIWCYAAGRFGVATMQNCLWDANGGLLVKTGNIDYPEGSDSTGGQSWQGGAVTDYLLDPGQYHLGFWCQPGDERVWSQASGTVNNREYFETATGGVEGWGSPDDINYDGAIMAYIVYEPANEPPSAPKLVNPSGGEIVDDSLYVDWNPATDPNQPPSALSYQVSVYDGSWHNLNRTDGGHLTVDFSGYRETSVARVRVRAYDGQVYGPWDTSPVFTISHNDPPARPTGLTPSGGQTINRATSHVFTWNHNDSGPQSRFQFRWRLQGASNWNIFGNSTSNEYVYRGSGYFPEGTIEWQVRTYDQGGLASPWSSSAIFRAVNRSQAPEILQPTYGQVVSDPSLTVQWSSYDQQDYHLRLYNGSTIMYENQRATAVKAETLAYALENSADYRVEVRIRDSGGLWSPWDSVEFSTLFVEPAEPQITLTTDNERGYIRVEIDNPVPSGDEPQVAYNDVYRRTGSEGWIKIADHIPRNFYFVDYTPGSGTLYDYRVQAYGENSATIYSTTETAYVALSNAILATVADPTQWLALPNVTSSGFSRATSRTQMQFNGRKYPVSEFGESAFHGGSLSVVFQGTDKKNALESLTTQLQPLLFRDELGRRMFVTSDGLSVVDLIGANEWYKVRFALEQIAFREAIE